jgi:hypothetical protein
MDEIKLRAWWAHRQGLDATVAGKKPSEVLESCGWARSVGGSSPYLALFARAGLSRERIDAAVAALEIHELPSARGCTYVLPAGDFALGLKLAQGFNGDWKVAEKLGVTRKEVDKLSEAVLRALEKGPLDPDGLRKATGSAVRNLGPEGQKKGVTTTLPLALGELQTAGQIRRIPINGRLDQQRYSYTLWRPNPLAGFKLSTEEAYVELARRFFRWIGPATLAQFQEFAAVGVKAAKAAVEPLKLEAIAAGDERLLLPRDREAFEAFRVPKSPQYVLLGSIDSMLLLRRDLGSLLDTADRSRQLFVDKGTRAAGDLKDLPSHAILDRGRIVGVWEYDPETESIAWTAFAKRDKALQQAVSRMEEWVRTELGDARSFSLDSPKSRAPRIAALRTAG